MKAMCTHCGAVIGVEPEYIGYSVQCPRCGKETIAVGEKDCERLERDRVVSARMPYVRRANETELIVAFFLGVSLNALGVAIAGALYRTEGLKASIRGMVYSFLLYLLIVVVRLYI